MYTVSTDLILRQMKIEDVANVMAIETMAYTFPWTQKIFHDCLKVGYEACVAEKQGKLIGYGIISIAAREAHILNLCVHPHWQKRGYGEQILRHLLDKAKLKQVDTIFLEVRISNQTAIDLYQKIGFNQIGLRHHYYPNGPHRREHALVFALSLME